MNQSNDEALDVRPADAGVSGAPAASEELEQAKPPRHLFLTIFPSIMLPMFLAVADQTIVATALPTIASDLGNVERASWVVVSYLIANTIAAPVYGRLGDTFGRRSMMIAALSIFMIGSVLCAISPNIVWLTVFRVIQGFGGGGLMTLSQSLIGETIPPRERGRYQGYLAGVSVSSSTFGPVAGGYLTEAFGWQSIFLVNVPLGLIAMVLVLRLASRPPDQRRTTFDIPGLVLFIMFVSPVILALEQLQRMQSSTLPLALGLIAFGIFMLAALLWQEARSTSPLIPPRLFREPSIWRCDGMAACHGAVLVSLITFLPIYLRAVRGASPAETGLLLLPLTLGIGVGSLITGQIVTRTGRTAIFPSIGMPLATLGLVLRDPVSFSRRTALDMGRHRVLHGDGDGCRAIDRADGGRSAATGHRHRHGAILALGRRGLRNGTRRRRGVRHSRGQRPRNRGHAWRHHGAGPASDRNTYAGAPGDRAGGNCRCLPFRLPHHSGVRRHRVALGVDPAVAAGVAVKP